MQKLSVILSMLAVSACTMTYPIKGAVDGTNERFIGLATVNTAEEFSKIEIVMDSGTKCLGSYPIPHSTGSVMASGTFDCSDKRTGDFTFTGDYSGGEGFGRFSDGKKFAFTYDGKSNAAMVNALAMQNAANAAKLQQPTAPTFEIPKSAAPIQMNCTTTNSGFLHPTLSTRCFGN